MAPYAGAGLSPADSKLQGTVLVTGAGGFIGSHLVGRLLAGNVTVRCLRHNSIPQDWLHGAEIRSWNPADAQSLMLAMQDVSVVFHLGGIASAARAETSPDEAFRVNTVAAQTLLEAARLSGIRRIVLLSTAHVYGPACYLPITEDHPLAPASLYAATKLAADIMARAYGSRYGIGVNILRPFNVYGPRQTANAVLPTIFLQALNGQPVRVQDLRPQRDFLYVDDVVEALLRAATVPATGQEIILASGCPVSVAALIREVLRSESGAEPDGPSDAPDEGDCLFGSPDRAFELLGWRPMINLPTGLARTIDWWRQHRLGASAPDVS